jgi:transcriptional regulator with XRE-family HTH domain
MNSASRNFCRIQRLPKGFQEMQAEIQFMQAIEVMRARQHISKENLAARAGKKREAVSRLLTGREANPTLNTILDLLTALDLTADITLRPSREGEGPLKVSTEPEYSM